MKLGFIGCGNMAQAIIGGIVGNQVIPAEEIIVSDLHGAGRKKAREEYGVKLTGCNNEVAKNAEVIILAIKPQYYETVIEEIKESVNEDQIIISIAPGKTLGWLKEKFEKEMKLVRTMPNTPALVGEGMTGACANENMTEEEMAYICRLLEATGKVEVVPEHLMDVVAAVSGSSPAYAFMFIEAMADAAVAGGMPRKQAYRFAAQAILGSAKMVLETEKHPGELKDMVCSPAGSTIEAVRVLEARGLRSAVIEAEKACLDKARSM